MNVPGPGPVPVPLIRLGLHGVTGPDRLPSAAPALHEPLTLGDVQDLAERVVVPRGPPAGSEVTLSIRIRDGGPGVAISSIHTWPVSQSRGPGRCPRRFLRISIGSLRVASGSLAHAPAPARDTCERSDTQARRGARFPERSWLIRAMWLIWCTIDPLIHHEARIHHGRVKVYRTK